MSAIQAKIHPKIYLKIHPMIKQNKGGDSMYTKTKLGLFTLTVGFACTYVVNDPDVVGMLRLAGVTPPPDTIFRALTGIGCGLALWEYTPDKLKSRKYEKIFKAAGLTIKGEKAEGNKVHTPRLVMGHKSKDKMAEKLLFSLPKGLSSKDFEDKQLAIQQALKAEEIETRYVNGKIEMLVKKNALADKYPFEPTETKCLTEIVIGYSKDGLATLKLDDSYTHLLVGGLTGYGKSTFILQLLTHLILTKDPGKLKICICDLKRIDLPVFEKSRFVEHYADTIDDTRAMLNEIRSLMYDRLAKLKKAGVNHIDEYREHMERYIVVVDELATLMREKDLYPLLHDIASKSRAVGIHLIVATQRPDANVVPGLFKAQFSATLAFRTRNDINSKILLDNGNAAELTIKGRAILQTDKETEVQVMHITLQQVRKMIEHTYIEKPKEKQDKTDGVISLADFQRLANN